MGMIFMTVERVLHFMLKAIWKLLCVAGALVVCAVKVFLMLLIAMLHIALGVIRLGETV